MATEKLEYARKMADIMRADWGDDTSMTEGMKAIVTLDNEIESLRQQIQDRELVIAEKDEALEYVSKELYDQEGDEFKSCCGCAYSLGHLDNCKVIKSLSLTPDSAPKVRQEIEAKIWDYVFKELGENWTFDSMQVPKASWYDKQDLLERWARKASKSHPQISSIQRDND